MLKLFEVYAISTYIGNAFILPDTVCMFLLHGVIFNFFDVQSCPYFVDGQLERRSSNKFSILNQGI
jgi:hypothetical protein